MQKSLTQGAVGKTLILFSLPMIAGNLLQQLYNIADTLIVGKFLGSGALAAVGSSYTLMTFLTSVFRGFVWEAVQYFPYGSGKGKRRSFRKVLQRLFY